MQRTSLKWGQAAKLAAGAALVFAMREQGRGDRTHSVAVSHSFSSLLSSSLPTLHTCVCVILIVQCAFLRDVLCPDSEPLVIGVMSLVPASSSILGNVLGRFEEKLVMNQLF
jgi:hypothetical protein